MDFRQAIREGLTEAMSKDARVVMFGEDVAVAGGVYQATRGLYEHFGPTRVFDTPISEMALAGAAFGSALCGLRPVVEIMYGDFLPLAMDSLINQASKYWFVSNEQSSVPLVVRSAVGGGNRLGPIHSQIAAPWFMSVPGLKIVAPSMPSDAMGLIIAAVADDNPVLFLEHKRLYGLKGEIDHNISASLGQASIVRVGQDLTVVTAMASVHDALRAADSLAAHHIDLEIIDLRSLRPFDAPTILNSVAKTRRLLVVEEGPRTGGWAAEVLATVVESSALDLDDAWRLTSPDLPLPYSPLIEDDFLPGRDKIIQTVLSHLAPPSHSISK